MNDESIFAAAIAIPDGKARAAFLEDACAGHPEMRRDLEDLLSAHLNAGNFLEAPPRTATLDQPSSAERPGTLVGSYKLLEQIGEGGFGIVFMAEQQRPLRRKVALKVVKPGMDTKQVVARFEAERQALALMDHPNIAKVHDGGTTETGRPYFVMELVRGVPITEFCDQNHLTVRERLELFVPVCQAVQHAHQKGVIHRDLKPTNVLVTLHDGIAVPKVIDFGVAKAMGQQLTERTLFTNFAQMVGTPLYMSPEQAEMSGLDVDTRADIYALGVMLYELLTGTTPLDKARLRENYDEIRRIIREEEPASPSTRISTLGQAAATVSSNRKSDPRKLSQLVRGELDWIVMKALEKDRNRRYESASALATDVQRYLTDEPVLACPPSAWYRFRKLARRNKAALATGSVVAVAMFVAVGGLATSTALILQALRSESEAKEKLSNSLANEKKQAYLHRIALTNREFAADNLRRARELLVECPEELRDWEWRILARLCHVDQLVIRNTTGINSVAFDPVGERIAGACGDGSLKVWDSRTGRLLQTIRDAHKGYATSVAFHPRSTHLASVGSDGLVNVWDLADTKVPVFSRPCDAFRPMGTAYAVSFRPDDGRYLVAGNDGAVNLWDWGRNQLEHQFDGHGRIPISVTFSRDGKWLASGDWQGRIKIWDVDRRSGPESTFGEPGSPLSALTFTPDAGELAAASYDRRVDRWVTKTGERLRPILYTGRRAVLCVAYDLNGRLLASAGEDKTIHVRDAATGGELLDLRGHTESLTCLAFSPDGQRLISSSTDGTIRVWDATPLGENERQEARTYFHHRNEIWTLAVRSTDGGMVVSGGFGTPAMIWDPQTGDVTAEILGQSAVVFCVAWSTDGRWVASAGATKNTQFSLKVVNPTDRTQDFEFPESKSEYMAVVFHPNGEHLVTGQQDGTIRVWDVRTHEELGKLGIHAKAIRGLAFSRDGSHLASMSADAEIKLWDTARMHKPALDGKAQLPVEAMRARSPGVCVNLAFSPDGQFLATGGPEYTVRILDVKSGREARAPLRAHKDDIYAVAFSPDGRWLASAGEDSTVRIWDCRADYALVRTFRGHTGLVNSLAFTPDSKQLFSGSNDFTVKVWDMTQLKAKPDR